MRRNALIVISVVFFIGLNSAFAQKDDLVTGIRATVKKINGSIPKYSKKTKLIEDISLEGAEATFYTSRYGLRKVDCGMFGETYRASAEFYYRNGELIFAFYRVERYDTHISADPPPKVVATEEKRLYFLGGELKRLIVDKTPVTEENEVWASSSETVADLDKKFRNALNQQ